jgi:integrase
LNAFVHPLQVTTLNQERGKTMAKRANSEGSIYERKDGRWATSITLENGTRKTVYGKTQKEVVATKQKLLQEAAKGALQFTVDQTVKTFLDAWLEDTIKPNLRYNTYRNYHRCARHIIAEFGNVPIKKLTPQHAQRLHSKMRAAGFAPGSVALVHQVLVRAMNDAVKWGLIERNTVSLATAPRVTKREMCVFTDEQTRKFLAEARGNYLEALFVLAVATGAREGELLGLSWGDVDLQTGKMQIKRILVGEKVRGLCLRLQKQKAAGEHSTYLTLQ